MDSPIENDRNGEATAAASSDAQEAPARDQLHLFIDLVEDYAIFLLDREGYVASWNRGAERLKGYKASEIIGQHFSRFYLPEDVANRKPWANLEVAKREGRMEEEGWRVRHDGSRFWANVVITSLYDTEGNVYGFGKVTRDLSERKRADEIQARLLMEQVAREAAEENARLQDRFFAVASHELRTPITILLGHLQLLERRFARVPSLDERELERLRLVTEQTRRLNRLVNALLDRSRALEGTLQLTEEVLDLRSVVEHLVDEFRPVIARTHQLHSNISPAPCLILGDRLRLEQVFQNILDNAVKYSANGGKIAVKVERLDTTVRCSISDNGIGIPASELSQIGERYFRAGNVRTHGAQGMGIGLSLVKQIVTLHHGTFEIASEEGEGTTVTLTFPRADLAPVEDGTPG